MSQTVEFRESVFGMVTEQATGGHPELISYVVAYAGEYTTLAALASATQPITLGGVLSTDVVVAFISFTGSTPRILKTTTPTTNTITFIFSGDPNTGTAHKVMYAVLRAV